MLVVGLWAGCLVQAAEPLDVEAGFSGDTLTIGFDAPMRILDNAVRDDLVTTVPALPWRCRFDDDITLACDTPEGTPGPTAATRYRVRLGAGLTTVEGAPVRPLTLSAETARPSVSVSQSWSNAAERPEIDVFTDAAVSQDALSSALRLTIDDRRIPVVLYRPDGLAVWRVRLPASPLPDARLRLAIVPGLRSSAGPLTGTQDRVLVDAILDPGFRVHAVSCRTVDGEQRVQPTGAHVSIRCTGGETMTVSFARVPDATTRDAALAAWPGARISSGMFWDRNDEPRRSYIARLELPIGPRAGAERSSLRFAFPASWRALSGASLQPLDIDVEVEDRRGGLDADAGRVLLAGADVAASRVTVSNAPDGLALGVTGLAGGSAVRADVPLPAAGARNAALPVTSADTAAVLRDGGWAFWSVRESRAPEAPIAAQRNIVEFAAPQLDVSAIVTRRAVVAWTHGWEGGALGGVEVELVDLRVAANDADAAVIVRGTTDRKGVALLALPEAYANPEGRDRGTGQRWLLRATHGRGASARHAVLPVSSDHEWQGLGTARDTALWGVTDRPLYRAGDTVRFRIWRRAHAADGLRVPAAAQADVSLVLQRADGTDVLPLTLDFDATGAADGELVLPTRIADGEHCLVVDRDEATCFHVAGYTLQDLWADASTPDRVLREGEDFTVDLTAGYYSGGAASGARIVKVDTLLAGQSPATAYPAYAGHAFLDPAVSDGDQEATLAQAGPLPAQTDADGHARIALSARTDDRDDDGAPATLPAFGLVRVTATVGVPGRPDTTSREARARFARFDAYAGLRIDAVPQDADTPLRLHTVLISADGEALPATDATVKVFRDGTDPADAAARVAVATCRVRTGEGSACAVPRGTDGNYRFVLRARDAAPASLVRWVPGPRARAAAKRVPTLVADEPSAGDGGMIRARVTAPHARAEVLYVLHAEGDVVAHGVVQLVDGAARIVVPRPRDLQRESISLGAWLHLPDVQDVDDSGRRRAKRLLALETQVALPAVTTPDRLSLAFDRARASPGATVAITLRNTGATPRRVTLAVMDDAARAQAQALADWWRPFKGSTTRRWGSSASSTGFADWLARGGEDGAIWRMPWRHAEQIEVGHRRREQLPSAPAPAAIIGGNADSLDRIEVTGSRIKRADVFETGGLLEVVGGVPTPPAPRRADGAAVVVRGDFRDTALWRTDLVVPAGGTLDVPMTLPDNLARWRAVAWSDDDTGRFEQAEATLESGLPLEVRLTTPRRVYVGDAGRVIGSVRHDGAAPVTVDATLAFGPRGGDGADAHEWQGTLAERAQVAFAATFRADATGERAVHAEATAPGLGDATGSAFRVEDARRTSTRRQVGWLSPRGVTLAWPALPADARDATLTLGLARGTHALVSHWTQDLRAYPHRCWEQILARAIGAALALERGDGAAWPDAQAAIDDALSNAVAFQDTDGGMRFFVGEHAGEDRASPWLTAWSIEGLELLAALGHEAPEGVIERAREALGDDETMAAKVLSALADEDARPVEGDDGKGELSKVLDTLPLALRMRAIATLRRTDAPAADAALRHLLAIAPARGETRALRLTGTIGSPLASRTSLQCELIALMQGLPVFATERRALIAGLADLQDGQRPSADTQAAARCLIALRADAPASREAVEGDVSVGGVASRLVVPAGEATVRDTMPATGDVRTRGPLRITPHALGDTPLAYSVVVAFDEDLRTAAPTAVGMALSRRYEVFRDRDWRPVAQADVVEGDWIRVTLSIDNTRTRTLVAITDDVPGGLLPTDLALSGVAGLDLARVGDSGSTWFATRQLDPVSPRFYAEFLPAGRHEVHWFARVATAGTYLAGPAVAELMYGEASHAGTASDTLVLGPDPAIE